MYSPPPRYFQGSHRMQQLCWKVLWVLLRGNSKICRLGSNHQDNWHLVEWAYIRTCFSSFIHSTTTIDSSYLSLPVVVGAVVVVVVVVVVFAVHWSKSGAALGPPTDWQSASMVRYRWHSSEVELKWKKATPSSIQSSAHIRHSSMLATLPGIGSSSSDEGTIRYVNSKERIFGQRSF